MSWPSLVSHFTDELLWYQREVAKTGPHSGPISAEVPLIDDHKTPKVILLRTEAEKNTQRDLLFDRTDSDTSAPEFDCKHCDRRGIHEVSSMGHYTFKSTIQNHLKMKHGISPEDSSDHIRRKYSWFDVYDDYDGSEDSDSDLFDFYDFPFPFPLPYFDESLDDFLGF